MVPVPQVASELSHQNVAQHLLGRAMNPLRSNADRLRDYTTYERLQWIIAVRFRRFPILAVPREHAESVMRAAFIP